MYPMESLNPTKIHFIRAFRHAQHKKTHESYWSNLQQITRRKGGAKTVRGCESIAWQEQRNNYSIITDIGKAKQSASPLESSLHPNQCVAPYLWPFLHPLSRFIRAPTPYIHKWTGPFLVGSGRVRRVDLVGVKPPFSNMFTLPLKLQLH